MSKTIQDALRLVKLTNDFRQVRRTTKVVGEERLENNSEHSFQLALLAWYLVDSLSLPYNKDLIIKYALIHDLVEVYAGDIDPFITPEKHSKIKKDTEAKSIKRIDEEFKDFPDIVKLIQEYEKQSDSESKFIYSLDKITPNLYIRSGQDDYYRRNNIRLEDWSNHNGPKASITPEVKELFDELYKEYEQGNDLFSK